MSPRLSPCTRRPPRRAISLVEAVIAMLILAMVAFAAVPVGAAAGRSASRAFEERSASRAAEAFLAWHLLLPFDDPTVPGAIGPETGETATNVLAWDDLDDADGWSGAAPAFVTTARNWTFTVTVDWVSEVNASSASGVETDLKRVEVSIYRQSALLVRRAVVVARPRRRCRMRGSRRRPRRGAAYLMALGLAILIMVLAFGGHLVARALHRSTFDLHDGARAELLARDGLAWGMSQLERSAKAGTWSRAVALESKSDLSTLEVTSADAVSGSMPAGRQPIRLTSKATYGIGARTLEADALPVRRPHSALQRAVAIGGTLRMDASTALVISDGTGVTATDSRQVGASVAGLLFNLSIFAADATSTAAKRLAMVQFPTIADVDAFAATGTRVVASGDLATTGAVVSPRSNPWGGAVDQAGVYVLDCKGDRIRLKDLRVAGTLVILDPGSGSLLEGGLHIEPSSYGYPALVVRGDMTIKPDASLRESSTNVNFNPRGTPYSYNGGSSDSDKTDTYTSTIAGAVIVSGTLTIEGALTARSVVVNKDLMLKASLTVVRDTAIDRASPDAFCTTRWQLDPTTIRRIVPTP